jgi:hypothetical protein
MEVVIFEAGAGTIHDTDGWLSGAILSGGGRIDAVFAATSPTSDAKSVGIR